MSSGEGEKEAGSTEIETKNEEKKQEQCHDKEVEEDTNQSGSGLSYSERSSGKYGVSGVLEWGG